MKIKVLGAGSAFSMRQYQSNFMIDFDGYNMLFDCGSDIRWSMHQQGYGVNDINGIFISHLHADHIGGLQWVALNRFFNTSLPKVDLYVSEYIVDDLWSNCLRGGLSTYQGAVLTLQDYFKVHVIKENKEFRIARTPKEDKEYVDKYYVLTPVQTVHIMSGYKIMPSFGLLIRAAYYYEALPREQDFPSYIVKHGKTLYITSDTQYSPYQIRDFYKMADLILQDCETAKFKSHVHAHYDDLKTLQPQFKNKMWLYHYNDQILGCVNFEAMQQIAKTDGFLGYLVAGQVIEI